jgi:hypothetical protein
METAPQEKKPGYRISLFSAIGGMVITFMLGMYVGVHPMWIPVKASSSVDDVPAGRRPVLTTEPDRGLPQTQPATTGSK